MEPIGLYMYMVGLIVMMNAIDINRFIIQREITVYYIVCICNIIVSMVGIVILHIERNSSYFCMITLSLRKARN